MLACLTTPLYSQQGRGSDVTSVPVYNGTEVTCHLPKHEHIKNVGGSDGSGLCVNSSILMAGVYQGIESVRDLQNWSRRFPGGSYPSKVDQQLKQYYDEKGLPVPPYMQVETRSPEKVMELIDKTGRMACITYGYSPRYGSRIAHMTCAPGYSKYGVCLDNNFPGTWEWMSKEELINRMKAFDGKAWIFVWLTPPPPPPPVIRNQK